MFRQRLKAPMNRRISFGILVVLAAIGLGSYVTWAGSRFRDAAGDAPVNGQSRPVAGVTTRVLQRASEAPATISQSSVGDSRDLVSGNSSSPVNSVLRQSALAEMWFQTLQSTTSEGYGPQIQRIALAGTPAEAMQALRQLRLCARAARTQEKTLEARPTQSPSGQAALTSYAVAMGEELMRCQTVTEAIRALAPELNRKALEGGEVGAADSMFDLLGQRPNADEIAVLLPSLRRDAHLGLPMALHTLTLFGPRLGLSSLDRRTYYLAHQAIERKVGRHSNVEHVDMVLRFVKESPTTRLSDDEERLASQRAEEILRQHVIYFCDAGKCTP